jgi:hypothetical protein
MRKPTAPPDFALKCGNDCRRVVSGACIQEVNERKYKRDVETEPAGKSLDVT